MACIPASTIGSQSSANLTAMVAMCDVPCQNFLTWSKDHTVVNSLSDKGRLCGLEGRGATTGEDAWHARQHFKICVNDCCSSAMRVSRPARGIVAGGGNTGAPPADLGLSRGLPNPGRPSSRASACEVCWCPVAPWVAQCTGHGVSSTKRQVLYTEGSLIYFVVRSSRNILVYVSWEIRYKMF